MKVSEYGKLREPYVDKLLKVRPTPRLRPYSSLLRCPIFGATWMLPGWIPVAQDDYGNIFELDMTKVFS